MAEQAAADRTPPGRLEEASATIRLWSDLLRGALAKRLPLGDDEVVEYIVGYVDPVSSWEVVVAEMAKSFPGATVRAAEIFPDVLKFLDQLAARAQLLAGTDGVLERLRASLLLLRDEGAGGSGETVARTVAELDHAIEVLSRLRGTATVQLDEPNPVAAMFARSDPNAPRSVNRRGPGGPASPSE